MKNNQSKQKKTSITDVKYHWEKVWKSLNEVNRVQAVMLPTILLVNQRVKLEPFFKEFSRLKELSEQFYDKLDALQPETEKVEPVEVKLPWDSSKFAKEWQNWKDYLKEQHGITISSRTEAKQLENLNNITKGIEDEAYKMINYSISSFYRTLFKLDEKQTEKEKSINLKNRDNDY